MHSKLQLARTGSTFMCTRTLTTIKQNAGFDQGALEILAIGPLYTMHHSLCMPTLLHLVC